ncbi:MAG TPA: hypothetical protein VMU47_11500 [Caldimonas sp.]|nr:hypothetical protein [Caldimonas sp.]
MNTVYKGYAYTNLTTQAEDGRYVARVAIIALDPARTRSQRFLDLESYATRGEADARVSEAAMAWIDASQQPDRLALPSRFSTLF